MSNLGIYQGDCCPLGPVAHLRRCTALGLVTELYELVQLDEPWQLVGVHASGAIEYYNCWRYRLIFRFREDILVTTITDKWAHACSKQHRVELSNPTAIDDLLRWLATIINQQEALHAS